MLRRKAGREEAGSGKIMGGVGGGGWESCVLGYGCLVWGEGR